MTTVDIAEFISARLSEDNSGRHLDFTSSRALAAAWNDHPDYKPEWAPGA